MSFLVQELGKEMSKKGVAELPMDKAYADLPQDL
jgi:hypothetical protein